VKGFHNLSVVQVAAADSAATPVVVFLAGDDRSAKETAARLAVDAGLVPFDTGDASTVHLSEAPGPLFMQLHTAVTVAAAVDDAAR